MGFWSALGSAAQSMAGNSSIGGDLTGGWLDYSSSQSKLKYTLKSQYKYAQKYALNSPSWNVEGLRRAGLNPILAVNGGNISDVNAPDSSMPSGGDGIGLQIGSKLDRDQKQSAIVANTALADKTKAEELKTLVSALNDIEDGGSKSLEGSVARFLYRSMGGNRGAYDSIMSGIGKRIGKLVGVELTTSAKDHRSDDGNVRPAPNSAKSSVSVAPASTVSVAPVNVPRRMRREIDFSKHDGSVRSRRHN